MEFKRYQRKFGVFLAELLNAKRFYVIWLLAALAICTYMWQWHAMPLFPDEVAFMVRNARFFADDGEIYGRFAACPSSANQIPIIFYPAAVLITEINSVSGWTMVRAMPYLSLVALIIAVFTFCRKTGKSTDTVLFLTAGFIGVAGSGLIMSRPEIYLVINGAACLYAYSYCVQERIPTSTAIGLLILLLVISNISLFVHPQGLVFVPVTLMLVYRISKSFEKMAARFVVISATVYAVLSVWNWYKLTQFFRCTENQAIADFIKSMTLPGWLKSSGATEVSERLRGEFFVRFKYFDKFEFSQHSQIDYLPPIDYYQSNHALFQLLKVAINLTTAAVLVAFVVLSAILLFRVSAKLYNLRREPSPWLTKLTSFATSDEVMLFTICWAHLGILSIVTQINFYRAFYLNLAMVVLLFISIRQSNNTSIRKYAKFFGVFSLSLCVVSTVVARNYIVPQLKAGYAGPSIPLATNWSKVKQDVQVLENECGISNEDGKIMVDDMTYDALKQHRRVLPITYIALSSEIMGRSMNDVIKEIEPTSAMAQCVYFDIYNIPYKAKLNNFCCTTYKARTQ